MSERPVPEIYADAAAATPLDARVLEAMKPFFGAAFGNPSSLHRWAAEPRRAVEGARKRVAALIGCAPGEIVFTSGATEANNLAVKGVAWASGRMKGTVLISAVEHLSVFNAAKRLAVMGFGLKEIPVGGDAIVEPSDVDGAIGDDAVLVSVNLANPEVGTVEPVKAIAEVTRRRGVPLHCDASAAAGWIPIDVDDLGVDLLTLSAPAFYGPKGAGALYVREGTRLVPLLDGGPQERGLRAGTENVAAIVGMGAAAELAAGEPAAAGERLRGLRDGLIDGVLGSIEGAVLTGHRTQRLPGHASFCFQGVEGEALLMGLDAAGVAASSGSACSSHALKISHVLAAMGVDGTLARGSLAVMLGRDVGEGEVDRIEELIASSVRRLRELSPI